ncbi:hypothetical protein CPB84DRAFT_1684001 [Gymnopilus junonius]|uniref:Uncharacterized protein n=1 Tax=Gymnopilus junonius TaxID=109634 RepID=A0A9P5NIU8_GYMJU|nr:hypothetical protein CPB84DRAFT_1684001 [Gymnopilus junonius]
MQITSKVAMNSFSKVASPSFRSIMEENAEANNVPRIGVTDNVCFPAGQTDPAAAVAYSDCKCKGLQDMGEFGSLKGHHDKKDSEGGLTMIIANSRLPPRYEHGRFHLLHLGIYVRLQNTMIASFCGLNLHGGTPPIALPGEVILPHAYRLIHICYPPSSMLAGSGIFVAPLASLLNGQMLSLGPEITTLL